VILTLLFTCFDLSFGSYYILMKSRLRGSLSTQDLLPEVPMFTACPATPEAESLWCADVTSSS